MLELKLLAMSDKNSEIVRAFQYNRYSHPFFREIYHTYLVDFYLSNCI